MFEIVNINNFLNPDYLDTTTLNMVKLVIKENKMDLINENEGHMEGSTVLYVKNPSNIITKNLLARKVFVQLIYVRKGSVTVEIQDNSKLTEVILYNIIEEQTEYEGKADSVVVKEGQILIVPIGSALRIKEIKTKDYLWMLANKYVGMKALSGTALTI